ncbi:unnamed protein product [Paramecium octaurelia]|uniref:Uncharacterized protein n=1 Tax=Paramecium octaurelia TaxID=43137 RepID=A0A8S1XS61_PAROT|nr:unnamed protein product [Paramecium octaurelia]
MKSRPRQIDPTKPVLISHSLEAFTNAEGQEADIKNTEQIITPDQLLKEKQIAHIHSITYKEQVEHFIPLDCGFQQLAPQYPPYLFLYYTHYYLDLNNLMSPHQNHSSLPNVVKITSLTRLLSTLMAQLTNQPKRTFISFPQSMKNQSTLFTLKTLNYIYHFLTQRVAKTQKLTSQNFSSQSYPYPRPLICKHNLLRNNYTPTLKNRDSTSLALSPDILCIPIMKTIILIQPFVLVHNQWIEL